LAKVNNEYIGICGLYAYKSAPKDAWLGWFGVVESARGKGYATKILEFSMQQAKKLGFETLRLYTDEEDNASAIKLYNKFGMKKVVELQLDKINEMNKEMGLPELTQEYIDGILQETKIWCSVYGIIYE
jgi:RimJ/RimL family protein N-acetyltransferase